MYLSYSLAVQQFTNYNRDATLQQMPYVYQSSRKRRITRIGTHIFSLGRMIFANQEFRVRMFYLSARAKNPVAEINTHRKIKSPLKLSIAARFSSSERRDYCPVSVDQSYDSDCSVAILTGD